jgi:hypothetical protein
VHEAIAKEGVQKVALAAEAPPIDPRVALELSSLAQIHALANDNAALQIAVLDPAALGDALSWRLARMGKEGERYTLARVELLERVTSEGAVSRERAVEKARRALIAAEETLRDAAALSEKKEDLYESRKKWRATWKVLQRTNEERLEAKKKLDEAQAVRDAAHSSYEGLAKAAEKLDAQPGGLSEQGAARATLAPTEGSGKPLELVAAAALELRSAPVPRITGADFPVSRASDLWPAIKDGNADQAIAVVRDRFSWHYAYVEIGGIKLGGMTLVQLAPLLLLPCLLVLIRRSRNVSGSYNPFDRDAASLPRVGLGPLNLIVLVLLPLGGSALCAMSLMQLGQVPVIPVLIGLGSIALGGMAHSALRELLDLRDAVQRSHSAPPPVRAG